MIIGIGTDLMDIRRIEKAMERFPDRFMKRILTPAECAYVEMRKKTKLERIAKFYATKEAAFKALGADRKHGISWQDFQISYTPNGQPQLTLEGEAKSFLYRKLSKGLMPSIHLSLTDEYPYAQAFVVIEAAPAII